MAKNKSKHAPKPATPRDPDPVIAAGLEAAVLAEPELPPSAPARPNAATPRQTHVMLPGDKLRNPTELETLQAEPRPQADALRTLSSVESAESLLAEMTAAHADGKRWQKLSDAQRYAITGACVAFNDCFGRNDWSGQPADFYALTGLNLQYGQAVDAPEGTDFETRAAAMLATTTIAHDDARRWRAYTILVRHCMKGAVVALCQALDRKDWDGKRASFVRHLGVAIRTHRPITPNSAEY